MLLGYKVDVVVVVRETRAMQRKIPLLLLSLAFSRTPPEKDHIREGAYPNT